MASRAPPGTAPGVWAPGDVLVIDWGEIGPLYVFCAVMAWSRWRFVSFADNERRDDARLPRRSASSTWVVCRRSCSPTGWAV